MRHAWLVLLLAGCRKPEPGPVPSRKLDASVARDAAVDAENNATVDAAVAAAIDAVVDAGPAAPSRGGVTLTIEDTPYHLPYGRAFSVNNQELAILLYADDFTCEQRRINDPPTSASMMIRVPPGPGAAYFAGHPISVETYARAAAVKIPVPRDLARAAAVQSFPAAFTPTAIVELPRVSRKEHARVRGTVTADSVSVYGTVKVAGSFDVELCDDLAPEDILARSAPSRRLFGRHGKATVAPRTMHAIVGHHPATSDEAALGGGSALSIDRIVLYAAANVACPPPGKSYSADAPVLAEIAPVGGTQEAHPVIGTQQPAHVTFFGPKGPDRADYDGIWPAWVQIDRPLSFTPDSKLRGTVWAQSQWFDDAKGSFGGRFEATVCP